MMMNDEDEEAMIDAKLSQLDKRLQELNSKLGGRPMRQIDVDKI